MRDAPRHVGPGRAALIEQLLRDVLETQDKAVALRHRLRREGRGLGILARKLNDRLALVADQQARQFGRDIINAGGHYVVVRSLDDLMEKMPLTRLAPDSRGEK